MGTIYKKDTLIPEMSVPAYNYFKREADSHNAINLTNGEKVQVDGKIFYAFGLFGSVISDNRDPVEAYERAMRNGHDLACFFGAGVCVAGKQAKENIIALSMDDIVYIEGHAYRLSPAANVNVDLTKIPTDDMVNHKYI